MSPDWAVQRKIYAPKPLDGEPQEGYLERSNVKLVR